MLLTLSRLINSLHLNSRYAYTITGILYNTDKKGQATQWSDEKEMQKAAKFQYPVYLLPNESMPEISLNVNEYAGPSRQKRQAVGNNSEPIPCETTA